MIPFVLWVLCCSFPGSSILGRLSEIDPEPDLVRGVEWKFSDDSDAVRPLSMLYLDVLKLTAPVLVFTEKSRQVETISVCTNQNENLSILGQQKKTPEFTQFLLAIFSNTCRFFPLVHEKYVTVRHKNVTKTSQKRHKTSHLCFLESVRSVNLACGNHAFFLPLGVLEAASRLGAFLWVQVVLLDRLSVFNFSEVSSRSSSFFFSFNFSSSSLLLFLSFVLHFFSFRPLLSSLSIITIE